MVGWLISGRAESSLVNGAAIGAASIGSGQNSVASLQSLDRFMETGLGREAVRYVWEAPHSWRSFCREFLSIWLNFGVLYRSRGVSSVAHYQVLNRYHRLLIAEKEEGFSLPPPKTVQRDSYLLSYVNRHSRPSF